MQKNHSLENEIVEDIEDIMDSTFLEKEKSKKL